MPVTRLRLSNCAQYLFSSGKDGHLVIYDVKDKDPRGLRKDKELGMEYSDEILTIEQQIEELNNRKNQLQAESLQLQEKDGVKDLISLKKKDEEHAKLVEDHNANIINDSTKLEALNSDKQNKASLFDGQLKALDHKYAAKKEQQKNQYSKCMLEDSTKYQKLQIEKEEKAKQFKAQIEELIDT